MDARLTEYGWSGLADCSISPSNEMTFDTEGYLVNENTHQTNKKKVTVLAEFTYSNLDLGLILWYNDLGYVRFLVNNSFIILEKIVDGRQLLITRKDYGALAPLVTGEIVTLKAELYDTNIKCYINDNEVINIEQTAFKQGKFGVHGSAGEKCNRFSISSNKFGNWQRSIANGTSIDKIGDYVQFSSSNTTNPFIYIYQDIDTSIDGSYTMSLDYIGTIHIELYNGVDLISSSDLPSSSQETRGSISFDSTTIPTTTVKIGIDTNGVHLAALPQVEYKPFDTSYTDGLRGTSIVTFPAGKMNTDQGAFALWIKPLYEYATLRLPIFYYEDNFQVYYEDGQFIAVYGSKTVSVSKVIEEGKYYFISFIWQNSIGLLLDVYDGITHDSNVIALDSESIVNSDIIRIGSTPTVNGNLLVDNLVVYKNHVDYETIISHKDDEEKYTDNVVIKSNFNKSTFVYNKNKIALPASKPNSPIVIETDLGEGYDRVCFVDDDKYVTYNKERFVYSGENTIQIAYDNLLKIEAYTANMDKIFNDISVDGKLITIEDIGEENLGSEVIIKYVVKNTYCINYDSEFGQYYIELSNTDGNGITIQYEEPDGASTKLVKTVEFNPFKAVNNSGFIYLEDTPRTLESLDVKMTPDSLVANGYDTATISIDCLSATGIPTSNVDLEVIAINGYGSILKYTTEKELEWLELAEAEGEDVAIEQLGHFITDEHKSGRFIYKYKAGRSEVELTDKVIIRDKISGIGIQLPIRLVRES